MGNFLSRVQLALRELICIERAYNAVSERIRLSPGLPHPNPSTSFWTVPPSPIATHRSAKDLPPHASVIIIGSGITGTAVARTLLDFGQEAGNELDIVMLEARQTCSGATGRNGGHINPPLYHEYPKLKSKYGAGMAKSIIRFRLKHIAELAAVAASEDPENVCQHRPVEAFDIYYDRELWGEAKAKLDAYSKDLPEEGARYTAHEGEDAVEVCSRSLSWQLSLPGRFHLSKHAFGCISTNAGAVHPYRLVTGILSRLLDSYPHQFQLYTETPCTLISPPSRVTPFYTVHTPSGSITTSHIVHATNAYTSHLLPRMRTKIIPIRGNMSAQRPGGTLSPGSVPTPGGRAYVFYKSKAGYDYLTQLPGSDGENELMFGGGFAQAGDNGLTEVGNTNDSEYNIQIAAHLSGALSVYFGETNWGAEATPNADSGDATVWFKGRVKALWSGILGISADGLPWVGRLPTKISGRKEPPATSTPVRKGDAGMPRTLESKERDLTPDRVSSSSSSVPLTTMVSSQSAVLLTAKPGEWIAAGYSGEGMVHAWMSGKALAYMILGREQEGRVLNWFPDALRITEKRWKRADVSNLL